MLTLYSSIFFIQYAIEAQKKNIRITHLQSRFIEIDDTVCLFIFLLKK